MGPPLYIATFVLFDRFIFFSLKSFMTFFLVIISVSVCDVYCTSVAMPAVSVCDVYFRRYACWVSVWRVLPSLCLLYQCVTSSQRFPETCFDCKIFEFFETTKLLNQPITNFSPGEMTCQIHIECSLSDIEWRFRGRDSVLAVPKKVLGHELRAITRNHGKSQ